MVDKQTNKQTNNGKQAIANKQTMLNKQRNNG